MSDVVLRLRGFRLLVRTLRPGRGGAPDLACIERVAAAVNVTADPVGYSCLRRAFAAAWMLQLRGIGPTLRYGVARSGGETVAHAWLDVAGHPVVGHVQAKGFTLLSSFGGAAER